MIEADNKPQINSGGVLAVIKETESDDEGESVFAYPLSREK